jgi:uncharacterized membrane protein
MEHLTPIGRTFFALALVGLGIGHFAFQEFITGRAPAWPESVPGGPVWAMLTGALLVTVGIALLAGRKARVAAILAAGLVFGWALLRQIPVTAASPWLSAEWTNAAKALRFVGGALSVAATLPAEGGTGRAAFWRLINRRTEFILVGRVFVGVTLIVNGLQHFTFTTFVASLIPAWFPGDALAWTYFGGVALTAGGLGLFIPQTSRWAAFLSGAMILSWFFIVHVSREIAGVADGIAVFEALATAGMLFVIAGYLFEQRSRLEWSPGPQPNDVPVV